VAEINPTSKKVNIVTPLVTITEVVMTEVITTFAIKSVVVTDISHNDGDLAHNGFLYLTRDVL